ncbi:MAG: DapH/DapD/GlmU-related protein [Proteobacteria bacterium]|nr:DapH/DapD/GlmU-related protein [Pseudomonadota bacterium]
MTLTLKQKFDETKRTTIGNDVWIGANVVILDGIDIGMGAIVAAGSIVTKDIEAFGIYGGIPAKFIRQRCGTELQSAIMSSKWWDWDFDILQKMSEDMPAAKESDLLMTLQKFSSSLKNTHAHEVTKVKSIETLF